MLPLDTGVIPALGTQLYQVTFKGGQNLYRGNDLSTAREQRILASRGSAGKEDVEYSNGLITVVFNGYVGLSFSL